MEEKALNNQFRSTLQAIMQWTRQWGIFLGMDRIVGASFRSESELGGGGVHVFITVK